MTLSCTIKLLALAACIASVHAQDFNLNATDLLITGAGTLRRLAGSAPRNEPACYAPFHNSQDPLFGGAVSIAALTSAIDRDFSVMSQQFMHVAPIAAKYGLKLYLGSFLTKESWNAEENKAVARAIQKYPDTIEVVLVGNENLIEFGERRYDILNKVNDIKLLAGSDVWRVKYGTVQRVTEFVESKYDWDMWQLANNLDILGDDIFPFFDNGYAGNHPTKQLDELWNKVVNKYPRDCRGVFRCVQRTRELRSVYMDAIRWRHVLAQGGQGSRDDERKGSLSSRVQVQPKRAGAWRGLHQQRYRIRS